MSQARQRVRPQFDQLSHGVAAYVRDLIMSGSVRGGEYLRVDRIAQDMQVSPTPVREALAVLRGEGFVDQEPRRGFVVMPLRENDVRDLFFEQARIAGELAARAAMVMLPDDVDRLTELQVQLVQAYERGDTTAMERLKFQLHREINIASNSIKLEWVLRTIMRYSPRRTFSSFAGWNDAAVLEHDDIIEAIRRRDVAAARAEMERHVAHAADVLVAHLETRGVL